MNETQQKFPWAHLMALGIGTLRLSPESFWRSTLREIASINGPPSRPMLRQTLTQMMQEFPDQP
jgi:uncharacterized phage protein (TIGR02216 family)